MLGLESKVKECCLVYLYPKGRGKKGKKVKIQEEIYTVVIEEKAKEEEEKIKIDESVKKRIISIAPYLVALLFDTRKKMGFYKISPLEGIFIELSQAGSAYIASVRPLGPPFSL